MTTTQEEALCYSSTLYITLKDEYYPWPNVGDGSVAGIYSPGVVIFRDDLDHDCTELPKDARRLVSVITVAAPRHPRLSRNEEAFANLVLPTDRKTLLRSLVEAHDNNLDFDDFVKGKGHGLVINLFGPPGVGKTLSAEATSEHVRRPLYVIGGGDLGTNGAELDTTLQRVFDIATAWQAIVLIDEVSGLASMNTRLFI